MVEASSSSSSASSDMDSLDDQDESVRIAVRALGDMRKGTRTSMITSHMPSTSNGTTPPSPSMSEVPEATSPDFVSRMTNLPLVGPALRAYEQGKASSRVMKYGAEMMECSVKSISRPVIDRLPVDVNQLDEFACRQLDRFGKYRRPSTADVNKMQVDELFESQGSDGEDVKGDTKSPRDRQHLEFAISSHTDRSSLDPVIESRTPTPRSQDHGTTPDQTANQQVMPRSCWQAVLLEAGGIGAAVSEESMRRLKYCLQWLQYATVHIDAQILVLRDFIASLQSTVANPSSSNAYISQTHMRTLTDVRKDIVNTIRQVVDVVSKYAGGALPEPARVRVRGFILHLPQRWASAANATAPHGLPEGIPGASSAAGATAGGTGARRSRITRHHKERNAGGPDRSLSGTPASSRAPSPLASSHGGTSRPTASGATRAAQHILTLATESLDMMRGVTGVVKDSLDRADAWVERLRIIGVQRQQQQDQEEPSDPSSPFARRRHSLPRLSSTPSTPAQANTPFSIPSTPAAPAYPFPEVLGIGLRLGEISARTSLSELRLDSSGRDADGYETPKCRANLFREESEEQRVWEKRSETRI
ncbi:hypothetical protein PAXRUDRAFT_833408 [Paxillus rubicundulus Ve08.2h10]|uniref:Opi1-domain-containing protein n=1 Tax=Paxillus rubicundulus Ve08.2h10 TaxID=930991 RepID=A0A0D0CD19_9AGAM|nr:hypothetical protein PAXRUDRAFT_833408 [Paxillus rubicundulus Ve08.2h10]